ncbi:MAG: diphosphokinase / guanosine-3,5-bis(diphosphate) 3-diphosphatase, partial [Patescibacteria group bacterium]|nr:diphosphokinase / guanosine-3,5-bis(diphosphate) 3-diphosphatase [Patescibacteria group bacterium]
MSEEAYREMSEKIDLEWEIEFLDLAYEIARESHEGVVRDSGEPYFTHPLAVAKITLEDFPNPTTFKAIVALLHDVIEDAEYPEKKRTEILSRFAAKAEEKRESFVKESGIEHAEKKIAFMKSFAESIVEAVELLSKKRKESYLHGWERPFLL